MTQRYVKIAERRGLHQVYWFIVEPSGRSYGGAIIGIFSDFGVALRKAESVSPTGGVYF